MTVASYQVVTADAVVGTSGAATVCYGISITSDGTAGVVILRNGTTTSGTAVMTLTGTASTTDIFDFGGVGVLFPDGLFADVDAHTTSSTVLYKKY
jgi:hypothetical protein